MAKQILDPGTLPSGLDGDTARVGTEKINLNFNEVYAALGASTSGVGKDVIPAALPINKGGTGAATAAAARANLGLGVAATWDVTEGTTDTRDRLMKVGDFGMGRQGSPKILSPDEFLYFNTFFSWTTPTLPSGMYQYTMGLQWVWGNNSSVWQLMGSIQNNELVFRKGANGNWGAAFGLRHTGNTTVDSNGFVKRASPVIQLFSDKIELNDEAQQQDIEFEKLGTGDYLIKNTSGFAQEGWYIEQPKDANGNVLVAVIYGQLENNDISVKTYKKKFDLETASIVADLENPTDIPNGRWIDIRLQELPQPEPEVELEPIAPPDFQPTNLSEAVHSFMAGGGYVSE